MAATFTAQLNLAKPATGDLDWGPEVDGNYDILDAAVYANREDRFLRIFGGGTLLYTANTGTITFSEDIIIHHGVSGFVSTLPATESPLVASSFYRLVYGNITRDPLSNETISVGNGNLFNDQVAVPSSNNAFIFAIRDNHSPVNQIVLFDGTILRDGEPGSLSSGSFVTLNLAYQNSAMGEIALSSNGKYFRIRAQDGPTDILVQQSLSPTTADTFVANNPISFAVQFTIATLKNISRLVAKLGKVGAPAGNYQYKIIKDSAGLPSTAGPDTVFSSSLIPVSGIPIVPADQVLQGGPGLVSLLPGTYWFVITVDATYRASVTGGNFIEIIRSSDASHAAATFNFLTTLWSASANHYYHRIFETVVANGPEIFKVSQASGGDVEVLGTASLKSNAQVEHHLSHTGLVALPVLSLTVPATIVLSTVEAILTVSPGDDLYLRNANDFENQGLYKILSATVNSPSPGQSTIVIDQTSSLETGGYRIALNSSEVVTSATIDVLRAADTNYAFNIYNQASALVAAVDSFRNRLVVYGDLIVEGSHTYINTETRVAETFLVESALTLGSQVLFDVNNSGINGIVARFRVGGVNALKIPFSGGIEISRSLLFISDNTYNIGAVGATRPANIYVAQSVVIGTGLTINATSIQSPGNLLIQALGTTLALQDSHMSSALNLTNTTQEYTDFVSFYGASTSLLGALDALATNAQIPAQLTAQSPATSKLQIDSSVVIRSDGTALNLPPEGSSVPVIGLSTIDFQTQGLVGGPFSVTFPPTSTVGFYRRAAFTVIAGGTIKVVFSAQAATLGAVVDPGTLFPAGIPLGWVDLICTQASPSLFKTANSVSNVIQNSVSGIPQVHIFMPGVDDTVSEIQEPLTGVVDGVNRIFTLSQVPVTPTALKIYKNSLYIKPGGYTLVGSTVTFTIPETPQLGQFLDADYTVAAVPVVPVISGAPNFIDHLVTGPEAIAKAFTLTPTPALNSAVLVDVYTDGPVQFGVDFTISGNQFQWGGYGLDGLLVAGDTVRLFYFS